MKFAIYIISIAVAICGILAAGFLALNAVNIFMVFSDFKMATSEFVQAIIVLVITYYLTRYFYRKSINTQGFTFSIPTLLNNVGFVFCIVGWVGLGLTTVVALYAVGNEIYGYIYPEDYERYRNFIGFIKEYLTLAAVSGFACSVVIWWGNRIKKWSGN